MTTAPQVTDEIEQGLLKADHFLGVGLTVKIINGVPAVFTPDGQEIQVTDSVDIRFEFGKTRPDGAPDRAARVTITTWANVEDSVTAEQ